MTHPATARRGSGVPLGTPTPSRARYAISNMKMNTLVRRFCLVECSTVRDTRGVPAGTPEPLNGGVR